jgi:hypothetical protein
MNLIDSTLKASVMSGFVDLFDTFARDVVFTLYKSPEETVLVMDPDYDSAWGVGQDSGVTYEEVSQAFPARIWYLDYEQQFKELFLRGEKAEGVRVAREVGQIKIQLKEDGYNYILGATRAYVFGDNWQIMTSPKKVGIFDFQFYTFILQKMP